MSLARTGSREIAEDRSITRDGRRFRSTEYRFREARPGRGALARASTHEAADGGAAGALGLGPVTGLGDALQLRTPGGVGRNVAFAVTAVACGARPGPGGPPPGRTAEPLPPPVRRRRCGADCTRPRVPFPARARRALRCQPRHHRRAARPRRRVARPLRAPAPKSCRRFSCRLQSLP